MDEKVNSKSTLKPAISNQSSTDSNDCPPAIKIQQTCNHRMVPTVSQVQRLFREDTLGNVANTYKVTEEIPVIMH